MAGKTHNIGQGSRTHCQVNPLALVRLQQHLDEVCLIRGRIPGQHNGTQSGIGFLDSRLNIPAKSFVLIFICYQRESSVITLFDELFQRTNRVSANIHFRKVHGHGLASDGICLPGGLG